MISIFQAQDLLALMSIPIMVITIRACKNNWRSLWDADLTREDNAILLRLTIFVLMPIIVLFHELGHTLAIIVFGGKVREFHYAFLWGYVVPAGNFTDLQYLIIYLAGNLVQVLLGLISLIIAFIAKSPPIVSVCTYLGLWSVAGTLVFYTMLSFFGAYGDWQAIYSSPQQEIVRVIAAIHIMAVIAIWYAVYGNAPRLWFIRKTNPAVRTREAALLQAARQQPSVKNYLKLAWLYYESGADNVCKKYLKLIKKIDPEEPEHLLIAAAQAYNQGNSNEAEKILQHCANQMQASALIRARAYMAIGAIKVKIAERQRQLNCADAKIWQEAVGAYSQAITAKTDLGDPYFYRAMLFKDAGLADKAQSDLAALSNLTFFDTKLFEQAQSQQESDNSAQKHKQ